jgi:hypothetical protein
LSDRQNIYGYYPSSGVKPTISAVDYFDGGSADESPVQTTSVFQVRVRWSKEMDINVEPTVWLTSSGKVNPSVFTGGEWETVVVSGDAYLTPHINLSGDNVGTVIVGVSGAQSFDGNVMDLNSAADLFTLEQGYPTLRGIVINEGDEYVHHPNVALKWSAVGADQIYISGDVQNADNTNQWISTNVSGDGVSIGSGDVVLASGTDGLKIVYAKFQTASGDESPFVFDYVMLDRSGDAITDVSCAEASGGATIGNADYTIEDEPYFSWSEPNSTSPIRGYAWALTSGEGTEAELPSTINARKPYVNYVGKPITPGKYKFFVKAQDEAGNWGSGDQFDYWLASGDSFKIAGRIRGYTDSGKGTEIFDGEATASGDGSPYIEWNDPQSPGDDTFYINTSGDNCHESNYEFSTADPNYTFSTSLGEGMTRILMRPITGLGISGDLTEFSYVWTSGSVG